MKESDRKFEKLLKEAVCSYHKEEMDALHSAVRLFLPEIGRAV